MSKTTQSWCFLWAIALMLFSTSQAWAGGWEVLLKEEGITVSEKEVAGRDLPIFRGRGVVKGNILEVLAVLSDTSRNAEWMHNCREARLLKKINDQERIIYNRTAAPWPVSDRDVVTRSKAHLDMVKQTVLVKFRAIKTPLQGEVEDVVRMPTLEGFYKLEALDEKRTRVTYQVNADPGGLLPDWLVSRTSREIPLHTIRKLRIQVKKTRGQYKDRIQAWAQKYKSDIEKGMSGVTQKGTP